MAKVVDRRRPAFVSHHPTSGRMRKAIVLVLVLIVVTMIALAGFSFTELMQTENKATHLNGTGLQLDQAIGSGVEYLKFFLEQSATKQIEDGGAFHNTSLFHRIPLVPDDRSGRTSSNRLRFSIVAPRTVDGIADGIRCGVENESGRLHLADLLRWDQQQPGSGSKALMNFPGMTEEVADAILDWIDSDSQPRPHGAESDYYAGLDRSYAPRNGLPDSLEELLLVKGVTRELLFGFDANDNYQLDPDELSRKSAESSPAPLGSEAIPWASLLTLYSGQRNLTSEGQPRIDLNSMDLAGLQSQLTAALDANWAAFIVAYRQYGPLAGSGTSAPATGPTPIPATGPTSAPPTTTAPASTPTPATGPAATQGPAPTSTTGPPPVSPAQAATYPIRSVLDLVGARVAVVGPSLTQPPAIYASPLADQPQAVAQQLPILLDKTTVINAPFIRGGVSVNHAPRCVLRCVPGIDEALADQILAARDSSSAKDELSRRFPTWLLTEGVVDLPTLIKIMPNICSGGEVVRAQVIGHYDKPGPTARAEVVLDATILPAQLVFSRDLRFWGLGFPSEWFGEDGERELRMR